MLGIRIKQLFSRVIAQGAAQWTNIVMAGIKAEDLVEFPIYIISLARRVLPFTSSVLSLHGDPNRLMSMTIERQIET